MDNNQITGGPDQGYSRERDRQIPRHKNGQAEADRQSEPG